MRTSFSPAQLADPATAASEQVIRKCVHCGFCTATCPTYVLLGDELDSPRGRIYLMKDMLEADRAPTPEIVKHVDRCLSCLSCMTTCPSGVNYMHLVDHARAYIEDRYRRPLRERWLRALLAFVLPHRARFRAALALARVARPLQPLVTRLDPRLGAMLTLAQPVRNPPGTHRQPLVHPSSTRGRVALLLGCAEPVLRPEHRAAAVRVLARAGFATVPAPGEGCCGALVHHMGREAESLAAARRNVDAWTRLIEDGGLNAILVTASGCGTAIRDYGFRLRTDPAYAEKAARVSALTRDITEFLAEQAPLTPAGPPSDARRIRVAYHPACSLQHGQRVVDAPKRLLSAVGYDVRLPADAHLCCGSAGTYNILQPGIAAELGARKASALDALAPDVIATGNIGCAVQIGLRTSAPVVHTVELLDWAAGGPVPAALAARREDLAHPEPA